MPGRSVSEAASDSGGKAPGPGPGQIYITQASCLPSLLPLVLRSKSAPRAHSWIVWLRAKPSRRREVRSYCALGPGESVGDGEHNRGAKEVRLHKHMKRRCSNQWERPKSGSQATADHIPRRRGRNTQQHRYYRRRLRGVLFCC